jgi:hypothetical protein
VEREGEGRRGGAGGKEEEGEEGYVHHNLTWKVNQRVDPKEGRGRGGGRKEEGRGGGRREGGRDVHHNLAWRSTKE